jgi:hypothetical protein
MNKNIGRKLKYDIPQFYCVNYIFNFLNLYHINIMNVSNFRWYKTYKI